MIPPGAWVGGKGCDGMGGEEGPGRDGETPGSAEVGDRTPEVDLGSNPAL
jgi:hypothetical protein